MFIAHSRKRQAANAKTERPVVALAEGKRSKKERFEDDVIETNEEASATRTPNTSSTPRSAATRTPNTSSTPRSAATRTPNTALTARSAATLSSTTPLFPRTAAALLPNTPTYARSLATSATSPRSRPATEKRPLSSAAGKWMPISFAKNELFDIRSNVMFEPAVQSKAAEKLKKNMLSVDPAEFLECAENAGKKGDDCLRDACLGMSFMCNLFNVRQERDKHYRKPTKSGIIVERAFSLSKAAPHDDWITLPSGRTFKIGHVLKPAHISYFSSEKFNTQCRQLIRSVYDAIEPLDDLFCTYSASPNAAVYLSVSDQFYEKMTEYFVHGYDGSLSVDSGPLDLHSLISRHCFEALGCKLNRVRAKVNKQSGDGNGKASASEIEAKELKDAIKLNGKPGIVYITCEKTPEHLPNPQEQDPEEFDEEGEEFEKENDDFEEE